MYVSRKFLRMCVGETRNYHYILSKFYLYFEKIGCETEISFIAGCPYFRDNLCLRPIFSCKEIPHLTNVTYFYVTVLFIYFIKFINKLNK